MKALETKISAISELRQQPESTGGTKSARNQPCVSPQNSMRRLKFDATKAASPRESNLMQQVTPDSLDKQPVPRPAPSGIPLERKLEAMLASPEIEIKDSFLLADSFKASHLTTLLESTIQTNPEEIKSQKVAQVDGKA